MVNGKVYQKTAQRIPRYKTETGPSMRVELSPHSLSSDSSHT